MSGSSTNITTERRPSFERKLKLSSEISLRYKGIGIYVTLKNRRITCSCLFAFRTESFLYDFNSLTLLVIQYKLFQAKNLKRALDYLSVHLVSDHIKEWLVTVAFKDQITVPWENFKSKFTNLSLFCIVFTLILFD